MKYLLWIVAAAILLAVSAYLWRGAPSPQEPQRASVQYSNAEYGISFSYPDSYILSEKEVGTGERKHYNISLTRKADLPPPQGGEWPPAITVDIYQNDIEKLSLEAWLSGTNFSNFKLSPDGTYATTTIAGTPAITYRWSGLYDGRTIAFEHKGNIVAMALQWFTPEDENIRVYDELVTTVQLTP